MSNLGIKNIGVTPSVPGRMRLECNGAVSAAEVKEFANAEDWHIGMSHPSQVDLPGGIYVFKIKGALGNSLIFEQVKSDGSHVAPAYVELPNQTRMYLPAGIINELSPELKTVLRQDIRQF